MDSDMKPHMGSAPIQATKGRNRRRAVFPPGQAAVAVKPPESDSNDELEGMGTDGGAQVAREEGSMGLASDLDNDSEGENITVSLSPLWVSAFLGLSSYFKPGTLLT